MAEKTVLHQLNAGMVLDRAQFVELPVDQMASVIGTIRAAPDKTLCVVNGAEDFFTPNNLITLIGAKDAVHYNIVNEALGGFFTPAQLAVLTQQEAIKPKAVADGLVVNLGNGPQKHIGPYQFAIVPNGWSVSNNMSLGPTKIKRKVKNAEGDGALFFMAPGSFEKMWEWASKAWLGLEVPNTMKVSTGVGVKQATIQDDRISLGGNYIRRYEIEQVAKYRGWAMPQAA